MATRETKLKAQIKNYLRLKGWFVFHVLQGLGAYKGVSDLIAIKDGKTLFMELKAPAGIDKNGRKKPAGKQSENQIQFEADIKAHGGSYYVIRSVEDIIEVIE